MSIFKVGDRVRRINFDNGLVKVGQIYEVAMVRFDCIGLQDYSVGAPFQERHFELAETAPKTDEELAAEYRAGVERNRETRKELEARGFVLELNGLRAAPINTLPLSKYKFVKTVTTTKEV